MPEYTIEDNGGIITFKMTPSTTAARGETEWVRTESGIVVPGHSLSGETKPVLHVIQTLYSA